MIKVELKDGSKIEVKEGSSILDIAKQISEGLARNPMAGRVDGEVKDLRTEIQKDCKLEILTFDDEDGKKTYWHTTSHIMAQAIKRIYGDSVKLTIGPSIANGFYYDFDVEKPFINLEIKNNENFKIVQLVEDMLNEGKEQRLEEGKQTVKAEAEGLKFNPEWIRIKVPAVKLHNYRVLVNDLKSKHYLDLKGEELVLGYFNGKTAKVKTYAELYSDENKNITANVNLNTFLPEFGTKLDKEDAAALKAEYDAKLKNIEKEAEEILSEARQKALKNEARIVEEAKEEASRIIKRANEEAILEKKRAMDEMKQEVIGIASMMAQKVVSASIDTTIQDTLVEETLKEMGDSTWQN